MCTVNIKTYSCLNITSVVRVYAVSTDVSEEYNASIFRLNWYKRNPAIFAADERFGELGDMYVA